MSAAGRKFLARSVCVSLGAFFISFVTTMNFIQHRPRSYLHRLSFSIPLVWSEIWRHAAGFIVPRKVRTHRRIYRDMHGRSTHGGIGMIIMPSVKLSTVGSRAFPAAASSIWNSLPEHINASTLQSFQHHLKTFLFRRSFPDILP